MAPNGVHHDRSDREPTWIARIQLFAGLLVVFGGVVVWAFTSLAGKANAADMTSVQGRVTATEIRQAHIDADLEWIKAALEGLTQHAGVAVQPPPPHP